jgi:cytochrome c peroxidase
LRHVIQTCGLLCAVLLAGCTHDSSRSTTKAADAKASASSPVAAATPAKESAPKSAEEAAYPLPPAPPLPPNPAFLPDVTSPPDNPLTPEKAHLGKLLFFDPHLSKSGQMSCEGCHETNRAFTVQRALSAKDDGSMNTRNAPTMLNLAFHQSYYWDGRAPTLEAVSEAAWKGQLGADPQTIADKLNTSPAYRALFQRAFGERPTGKNIPMAFASFFRTLKSGNSPWDRFEQGEKNAVSKQAQRGFEVFRTANCALCHVPPLYSDFDFHNVGIGSQKLAKEQDIGRQKVTQAANDGDMGKFKTPSLRDVALTAPYFHDGSVATLDEAITLMAAGGHKNPHLDPKLKPVKLSGQDKAALKAFLEALTGKTTFEPVDWVPPIP